MEVDISIADARSDSASGEHRAIMLAAELSADFQRADAGELIGKGLDILMQEVDDGFR